MNATVKRWEDAYDRTVKEESELLSEIEYMEDHSMWIPGVSSKTLRVLPINTPIEASLLTNQLNLDYERTYENATDGPKLILQHDGEHHNISGLAKGTLQETAKLNGAALGRMTHGKLADTLNNGLEVARGNSLLLLRHDKIMAFHSGAEGGYCVMPISDLLRITKEQLEKKFGEIRFEEGYTSNAITLAFWELPEAQSLLIDAYQDALSSAISSCHAINFMPAVRFSASDTARSCAELVPYFKAGNFNISFGTGVSVRHEKKASGSYGLELFEEEVSDLFAKFDETFDTIKRLAEIEIFNAENCFVGLINRLNKGQSLIPKKYADEVREEIANFAQNYTSVSAHDIYISMCRIPSIAKASGATKKSILTMEETLSRVLSLDWEEYDIGGTVTWGK